MMERSEQAPMQDGQTSTAEPGEQVAAQAQVGGSPDAAVEHVQGGAPGSQTESPNTAPAREQAPVATDRDKAIVGDSGMYEQQPTASVGDPDQPHRTSAPPANLQSGVPLAEDRAAGVRPGDSAGA